MNTDEVIYIEKLEPLGFKFIRLGLQDVLYDVEHNTIYTPNTGDSIINTKFLLF